MPNYAKGKVYIIRSQSTDQVYIGVTTQPLAIRFGKHKAGESRADSGVQSILEAGGAYIELLERYPCNSREELAAREKHWIRSPKFQDRCVNSFHRKLSTSRKKTYTFCSPCNNRYSMNSFIAHRKTKKHFQNMENFLETSDSIPEGVEGEDFFFV